MLLSIKGRVYFCFTVRLIQHSWNWQLSNFSEAHESTFNLKLFVYLQRWLNPAVSITSSSLVKSNFNVLDNYLLNATLDLFQGSSLFGFQIDLINLCDLDDLTNFEIISVFTPVKSLWHSDLLFYTKYFNDH